MVIKTLLADVIFNKIDMRRNMIDRRNLFTTEMCQKYNLENKTIEAILYIK